MVRAAKSPRSRWLRWGCPGGAALQGSALHDLCHREHSPPAPLPPTRERAERSVGSQLWPPGCPLLPSTPPCPRTASGRLLDPGFPHAVPSGRPGLPSSPRLYQTLKPEAALCPGNAKVGGPGDPWDHDGTHRVKVPCAQLAWVYEVGRGRGGPEPERPWSPLE